MPLSRWMGDESLIRKMDRASDGDAICRYCKNSFDVSNMGTVKRGEIDVRGEIDGY